MPEPIAFLSYCGLPPVPGAIWSRWNLDPLLLSAIAACAIAYGIGCARLGQAGPERWRQASFHGGLVVLAICFVSPLCALSVALFSARVAQHMLVVLVAAPLLVLGRFDTILGSILPERWRVGGLRSSGAAAMLWSGGLFALALWFWHMPAPYDASLRDDALYWAMHLSLLASALWFWEAQRWALDEGNAFAVAAAGLATTVQMSLLGALLTFIARPLFESHATTTAIWGFSPLADQQLGGLIMWVPGGAAFSAVALLAVLAALEPGKGRREGAGVSTTPR